jgi:type IV secretory pathway VirB4 component
MMAAQMQAQRIAGAEQDLPRRIPYTAMVSPHNLRCAGGAVLTCFKIGGVAHEAADDEDLQAWHDSLCGL